MSIIETILEAERGQYDNVNQQYSVLYIKALEQEISLLRDKRYKALNDREMFTAQMLNERITDKELVVAGMQMTIFQNLVQQATLQELYTLALMYHFNKNQEEYIETQIILALAEKHNFNPVDLEE